MNALIAEVRHNPLLWLLVFVPVVFAGRGGFPESHTLLFLLSVLFVAPVLVLLSYVIGPTPMSLQFWPGRW